MGEFVLARCDGVQVWFDGLGGVGGVFGMPSSGFGWMGGWGGGGGVRFPCVIGALVWG